MIINDIHQIQAKKLCIEGLNVSCCLNLNFPKNKLDLMTCNNLSKTHPPLSFWPHLCHILETDRRRHFHSSWLHEQMVPPSLNSVQQILPASFLLTLSVRSTSLSSLEWWNRSISFLSTINNGTKINFYAVLGKKKHNVF